MPHSKEMENRWYDMLVVYVPKAIKSEVSKAFRKVKNSILSLYDGVKKKTLKDTIEKKATKENQEQREDEADLTPQEHERALKEAYRKFVIPRLVKADIDGYVDQVKLHVKGNAEY